MATNFLWGATGTVAHLLTTELNSLANGTLCAIGPEINNSAAYQFGVLYVHMGSAAFVAPSYIQIFLVPSSDTAGATYPTFTSAAAAGLANYLVATIYINGSTAVQNETYLGVMIPPGKFKTLALTGGSCPTLAGTLNTVDLYPTPTQY